MPPRYPSNIRDGALMEIHSTAFAIGEDTFFDSIAQSHILPCSDGFIVIQTFEEGGDTQVVKADRLKYADITE